jgi:hypothetical protein
VTSITSIRNGLATNLATISGLRATSTIPDNPMPPQAIVMLENVDYDNAFRDGLVTYQFRVSVLVARADERTAQDKLNAYASTGAGGIKAAVESDKTLGGTAFDVRVSSMTNIGAISLGGDVAMLSADFIVTVYSN